MVMCVPRRGECLYICMYVCMYLAAWCVCPPYVPEKRPPTHTRDVNVVIAMHVARALVISILKSCLKPL